MTLAGRLRDALSRSEAGPLTGDGIVLTRTLASAAVLVPITDRAEPGVLLTLRHADLRRHPGQVAFPGGRVDPHDDGPVGAALREAREEIGLDPALVELVGTSDRYQTGSGFDILPVIGVVPPDLPLVPQETEVAATFEVPLAFLLDETNQVRRSAEFEGHTRSYYEILWGEWRIWGVTAGMIVNLSRRLRAFA